jgi:ectoine hydroxylase-related dioxygenase (phytanoyl-CoA dioxygenase family)
MNLSSANDCGFHIVEEVLSTQEYLSLLHELSAAGIPRSRAGARHLMSVSCVSRIANDARLLQIASKSLGQPAIPYRATLFEKLPQSNWLVPWHQDIALPFKEFFASPEWGPWSEKAGMKYAHAPAWALERVVALRLHLDASTHDNGPLRVVPGSHKLGVLEDEEITALVEQRRFVECAVPQGGVLAMRPLIVHASSKVQSQQPRRVLHIEYSDTLQLAPGIELAMA